MVPAGRWQQAAAAAFGLLLVGVAFARRPASTPISRGPACEQQCVLRVLALGDRCGDSAASALAVLGACARGRAAPAASFTPALSPAHSTAPCHTHCRPRSLTEGFHAGGTRFHPYALHLRSLLERAAAPHGCRVALQERGHSGERVMPSMRVR
jgi:hypothetical protein